MRYENRLTEPSGRDSGYDSASVPTEQRATMQMRSLLWIILLTANGRFAVKVNGQSDGEIADSDDDAETVATIAVDPHRPRTQLFNLVGPRPSGINNIRRQCGPAAKFY